MAEKHKGLGPGPLTKRKVYFLILKWEIPEYFPGSNYPYTFVRYRQLSRRRCCSCARGTKLCQHDVCWALGEGESILRGKPGHVCRLSPGVILCESDECTLAQCTIAAALDKLRNHSSALFFALYAFLWCFSYASSVGHTHKTTRGSPTGPSPAQLSKYWNL